jgi:hypothetical protein
VAGLGLGDGAVLVSGAKSLGNSMGVEIGLGRGLGDSSSVLAGSVGAWETGVLSPAFFLRSSSSATALV